MELMDLFTGSVDEDQLSTILKENEENLFLVDVHRCQEDDRFMQGVVCKKAKYFGKVGETRYFYPPYHGKLKALKNKHLNKQVIIIGVCSADIENAKREIELHKEKINEQTENVRLKRVKKKNGLLSDEGWEYYDKSLNEMCKNDPGGPEHTRKALWFVRKEMTQRGKSKQEAIENTAVKYDMDEEFLLSRMQSSLRYWGHALHK